MNRKLKRPAALAAVALLAVVGGGVAYATTSRTSPRVALLDDAAHRLNVTPQALRSALQGAAADQLDQAVKDGKLTQQQADRIKQRLQHGGGFPPLGGPGAPGRWPGGFFALGLGPDGPLRVGLGVAAKYLGLTPAQLRQQLASGKTLADVAKAQGRTAAGLTGTLTATAKDRLDKAVKDGKLTAAQHDKLLARLDALIGDIVQGKRPGPPMGGPGFGRMGGPGQGPPPWRHR
jgi:polyhydroxyalkanoate synthesis regulator phasin